MSRAQASGPEWYSGPVVRCTSSWGRSRSVAASVRVYSGSVGPRTAPFGFPVVPDV